MIKKIIISVLCITIFNNIIFAQSTDTSFVTHCTITTYNQGTITKDGSKINHKDLKNKKIKWCAVSRDLLYKIGMGDIIEIDGLGRYEVHDTTGPGLNHTIDILQHYTEKNFKLEHIKVKLIKKFVKKDSK